jgi:hypothetical protein
MRLEDISVRLRKRSGFESIDLGYAMTLAWRRDIFPVWASVYLVAALLINLAFFAKPVVAMFVLWWLKPAFDRVILHVLAGAAFGVAPGMAATWRALPSLWSGSGMFAALTWWRFDGARSFNLPISQLEQQSGKAAAARRNVLGREGRGTAVWLTIISAHFEVLLVLSIYAFAEMFLPGDAGSINPFRWIMESPPDWLQWLSNFFSVCVVLLLEPFYVAAGFALYLNTRTTLEGWDIELAFKRMSERLRAARRLAAQSAAWRAGGHERSIGTPLGIVFVLSVFFAAATPHEASAQVSEPQREVQPIPSAAPTSARTEAPATVPLAAPASTNTPSTGAAQQAKQILSDPMFGESRETWSLKYVGPGSDRKRSKPFRWDWLEHFGEWLAYGLRALAWGLGAAAIVGLLYLLIRKLEGRDWQRRRVMPDMLFGLDVRPDSLPDDVPGAAAQALSRGDVRLALSLLYRAALVSLIADGRFEIAPGDTEGTCAAHVARHYGGAGSAKPEYFRGLVATWQRVAYARQTVSGDEVEQLIAAWSAHFSLAGRQAQRMGERAASGAVGALT